MIIGITGQPPAGSGKDTVADFLVKEYGFVSVAFADPMKRICADVFGWDKEVLWGSSEKRNEPDKRFKRPLSEWHEAVVKGLQVPRELVLTPEMSYLTPRYALQRLGQEWARDCYADTWVDYGMRVIKKVLAGEAVYTAVGGLDYDLTGYTGKPTGIVIPDVRYNNEAKAIREADGRVWLVQRPGAGLKGEAAKHASEVGVSEENIDFCIKNNKGFDWLYQQVQTLMSNQPTI